MIAGIASAQWSLTRFTSFHSRAPVCSSSPPVATSGSLNCLWSCGSTAHYTPTALHRAVASFPPGLAEDWLWWRLPAPPATNLRLVDLLDDQAPWHDRGKTEALIDKLSPASRADVAAARASGKRVVGGLFLRTRPIVGPQAECRFDGIAGCLRVATGGSSRQSIVEIRGDEIRTRLQPARMRSPYGSLPDVFTLPANVNDALTCVGDGVVVRSSPSSTSICSRRFSTLSRCRHE